MTCARFYRRRFLNRRGHHAGAYIIADIGVERGRGPNSPEEIDASLTIADCSRIATLDFSASSPSELSNALFKARALLAVVTDFTAALEDAADQVELPGTSEFGE